MLTQLERFKSPLTSIIRSSDGGGYYKMIPGKEAQRLSQKQAMEIVLKELEWEDEFVPHNVD